MEFRCPACDTSYRVPVRIDQQVRCARCNHVWRIAESDFVFAEEAQDESEMPEAFSSPGVDDEPAPPRAQAEGYEGFSEPVEGAEDWIGGQTDEPRTGVAWPDSHQQTADDGDTPDFDTPASEPEAAPGDTAFDTEAGHAQTDGPSEEDADNFDRRLAGTWFAGAPDQPEAGTNEPDAEPHAAFDRIMEGIEDVIAEGSGSDNSAADRPEPQANNPLRALMSEERARQLGGTLQGDVAAPQSEDDWGGKVVRLTARGGERGVESRAQDRMPPRADNGSLANRSESVEPMADLIDKIAAGRTEPEDFTEPDDGEDDAPAEVAPTHRDAEQMGNAHFAALQADLEDAAHAVSQPVDPHAQDEAIGWTTDGYQDDAHEEAQRESLAFGTGQDACGMREDDVYQRDALDDSADHFDSGEDEFAVDETQADALRDEPGETWRDEPADIFATQPRDDTQRQAYAAALDAQDDDALLVEYDFGEEAQAGIPPQAAEPSWRGSGTLTVIAAWALFVVVMAAAAVSAISFRDQIADTLPASAPFYAAIGLPVDPPPLVFGEVGYSWDEGSANTLILTGQVTNNRSELTEMPNMQITARDDSGEVVAEESQFLGQSALVPGETYEFRVQVEVRPEKLETVELRF